VYKIRTTVFWKMYKNRTV